MKAAKRDLLGRRIVAVNWRSFKRAFEPTRLGKATDPLLTLDNGRTIWFTVDETDVGEYGVCISISQPKEKRP
jgi:hypothetical protein